MTLPIVGFTTDSIWGDDARRIADVAAHCPRRPLVRVVFDRGQKARDYRRSLERVAKDADVMGLPIDSFDVARYTANQVEQRFSEYVGELGDLVRYWEIGNEVNGEWLAAYGRTLKERLSAGGRVVEKIERAHGICIGRKVKTAITWYVNVTSAPFSHVELFGWMKDHPLPTPDLALLSRYDDEEGGELPLDLWQRMVERFATAAGDPTGIGIGECGVKDKAARRTTLARFGQLARAIVHPKWVGFGGWWTGRQDFYPPALNETLKTFRQEWFA